MAGGLKAIETRYKGYRFRSRLEARWAVFWETLGVDWEYEPEGFELEGGYRYLPDFHLTALDVWIETKPVPPTGAEKEKVWRFAKSIERPVLIISGPPWGQSGRPDYSVTFLHMGRYGHGVEHFSVSENGILVQCSACSALWFVLGDGTPATARLGTWQEGMCDPTCRWPTPLRAYSPALVNAYAAARGARFEHGEHG